MLFPDILPKYLLNWQKDLFVKVAIPWLSKWARSQFSPAKSWKTRITH